MYTNFQSFKADMKAKRTAVLGVGVSNTPLIELLVNSGAEVIACDKNERLMDSELYRKLTGKGVTFHLGDGYLDDLDVDIIFKSPGIRFDLPQLTYAREKGACVTSEMEVFFQVCPCKIIGVTGSDGKTTTTTLIYKILEASGYNCHLGGNIGKPLLCEVPTFQKDDIAVLELSSFQLHTFTQSPQISIITNLSPNHLDMHKSMEEYVDAKSNIFRFQNSNDTVVLNCDNDYTREFAKTAVSNVIFFSKANTLDHGIFYKDEAIYKAQNGEVTKLLNAKDILIPGMHNVENYMAAIAAINAIGDSLNTDALVKVARTFGGVEHRIELVRELGGVKYYNSSIDSSPSRSTATLSVFKQKVIMIAGGKDKNIPYDSLGEVILDRVKALILIGATSEKIFEAVEKARKNRKAAADLSVFRCSDYNEVVKKAQKIANKGDIVVLSPASTSFDMFKNFEERGKLFKKLVMELN